jgi:NADH-quinone oxidoreductase subunit G
MPHIFGSEELSSWAPAIVERIPAPYIALNPEDAHAMGATPGDQLKLRIGAAAFRLPLITDVDIPRGCALAPAGLRGTPFAELPALADIEGIAP